MEEKYINTSLKHDGGGPSLMIILHAISRMSKDELDLLKKMRKNRENGICLNENENRILPHILEGFNAKTIQEVITTVEQFRLFDLYDL